MDKVERVARAVSNVCLGYEEGWARCVPEAQAAIASLPDLAACLREALAEIDALRAQVEAQRGIKL